MKKKLSLIAILFLLSACGDSGSTLVFNPITPLPNPVKPVPPVKTNEIATMPLGYKNVPAIEEPNNIDISSIKGDEHRSLIKNIYSTKYLSFKSFDNPASYNEIDDPTLSSYGFTKNFNQGFAGNGVVMAVIDSGTDNLKESNVVINKYFKYKTTNGKTAMDELKSRLDVNNFTEHEFLNIFAKEDDDEPNLHGKDVMATANGVAGDLRFANVILPFISSNGNPSTNFEMSEIDLFSTIDALSNKGVRFFNRSYGGVGDVNKYDLEAPALFFTAIMKNNALVFSAAGNEVTYGTHTDHALAPDSPLRKGWIIVAGYQVDEIRPGEDKERFYIVDEENSTEIYVYHQGDTCKSIGWDDCISAPFKVNGNYGTSFSTPVTGATAALVYEKYPWMSNDNIKETLFTTVYKVHDSFDYDKTDTDEVKSRFGVGILNPGKAMNGVAEFRHDFEANVDIDNLYVFSNDIKGIGGIIKDGIGTLALTGDNTFSGLSKVKNGTLWLSEGQNYKADFENDAVLRLSDIKTTGKITNNATLINEGDNTIGTLELRVNSKIYSNLGDTIKVINDASLDGEFNLVGVNYAKNIVQGQDVDLLTAASISGQFKDVKSISSFLDVSTPTYDAKKVSVKATKIDIDNIYDLDDYAAKNYKSLFTMLDNKMAYELNKHDTDVGNIVQIYEDLINEYNNDSSTISSLNKFASAIINTPKAKLNKLNNEIFATDLYTNSLMSLARIKSLLSQEIKPYFNMEQSYNYNKINSLKEDSYETFVSNNFVFDDFNLGLGFSYTKAKNKKDDFDNNSTTIGVFANHSIQIDNFHLSNKLAYFNIDNKYNRFNNSASFKNDIFAFSTKLAYELNSFSPYLGLNAVLFKQGSFSEATDEFAVEFDNFRKNFYYANLGLEYKNQFDNLSVFANADLEYNFNKVYSLNAKNRLVGSEIAVGNGDGFKKILINAGAKISYQINNRFDLNMSYQTSFAKDYFTNKIQLGFNYIF